MAPKYCVVFGCKNTSKAMPDLHFLVYLKDIRKIMKPQVYKPETYLHFAYGENLLTFRMHMMDPTSEFISIARLDNYRLDFTRYNSFWGGPTTTIVPTANAHVWGLIWRHDNLATTKLDEQHGVEVKRYYLKYVTVLTPYMGSFTCRTFIQEINPLPRGDNEKIPVERWPSWTLKEVMIMGAVEHRMPPYYIQQLKKIKDNGQEGALRTVCLLIRYGSEKPCECRVPGRIPRAPLKLDLRLIKKGRDVMAKAKKDMEKEKTQKKPTKYKGNLV